MMGHFFLFMLVVVFSVSATGCVLRGTVDAWRNDMYNIKMRVLGIEQGLDKTTKKSADKANINAKQYMSNRQRLDTIDESLQNIRGKLDALKVGVITGRYPGLDVESESVAGAIGELEVKVAGIEESHTTLMQEFKRLVALYDRKNSVRQNKKRKKITTVDGLRTAFSKKRFTHIFEDARGVVKRVRNEDSRQEAMYLYAESTYKLGKIRDAALHFNELVDFASDGKYVKTAKVRLGDCFRHLGDVATAKLFYEDIIDAYPKSDEAQRAAEKLKTMQ